MLVLEFLYTLQSTALNNNIVHDRGTPVEIKKLMLV